jgi:predicted O-methyltransferase YrrM
MFDTMKTTEDMARFLAHRGQSAVEGSSSGAQQDYLQSLVRQSGARLVGEVGFNAGFSSLAFLNVGPEVKVISFDIGHHMVVYHAKEFIDEFYPDRHELIIGDSALTVPQYEKGHPYVAFDVIFIDGGHHFDAVRRDIVNLKPLSHPETLVVVDDLTPWLAWGEGPTKAWNEAVAQGIVAQIEIVKDGKLVQAIEPPGQRSWALGQYR